MTPALPELTVFISHTSTDARVATALIRLLEQALKLPARQIRCTSVDGYRLPVGADTDEQLRREIFVSKSFIGLLTPSSVRSAYVLFELGARWGAKRHLAPVLSNGADHGILKGPLSGLNALSLDDRGQVLQLVEDMAEFLELPLEPIPSFQGAVDSLVSIASQDEPPAEEESAVEHLDIDEKEEAILQYLATAELPDVEGIADPLRDDPRYQPVAGIIRGKRKERFLRRLAVSSTSSHCEASPFQLEGDFYGPARTVKAGEHREADLPWPIGVGPTCRS